jgi:hypothetical protein
VALDQLLKALHVSLFGGMNQREVIAGIEFGLCRPA